MTLDFTALTNKYFPSKRLKLVPEISIKSLVRGIDYPTQITNDNAPYALPYWHSQAIARYILDNHELFVGRTVLDVGCGCGASSIAAAKVGAKAIALDPDLRCLDFTERNAKINGVSVDLVWGDHRTVVDANILIAGGVFHEPHGVEIAKKAESVPSVIAVSRCNLWDMRGFEEVKVYEIERSFIHVFKSEHL